MSTRRSSRIQDKAAREAKQREDTLNREIEYNLENLSVDLTDKQKQRIARNIDDELKFPINSEDWIIFFCEYFDYIGKNMSVCLKKVSGLSHFNVSDFYKVDLVAGGFDNVFDNQDTLNFNIGLYDALFKQFKDGTNQINNCKKLNLLLSYIGDAVLRMADHHKRTSINSLIEFYRRIATILELAVYPEVFMHYMTGDSSGNTTQIDFSYHNKATHSWYIGIWLRKQEFLGVISGNGMNYLKKYDEGLRLFIRNYIRRLIEYMRIYSKNYPLAYEQPYNYSCDVKKVLKFPLPYNGVHQFAKPKDNYYISRDDWDNIPNILLPSEAVWESFFKKYKNPKEWNNPPPKWWIDRTVSMLDGFEWWEMNAAAIQRRSDNLEGTKQLTKWLALNSILPEQIDSYDELWEVENEDDEAGMDYNGGANSPNYLNKGKKKAEYFDSRKVLNKKFQILPQKVITLDNIIYKELNDKIINYFKLNIEYKKSGDKKIEGNLRNDTYIDNLNSTILYCSHYSKVKVSKVKVSKVSPKKKVNVSEKKVNKVPSSSSASRATTKRAATI
jgi:hypothetical protein